MSGSMLWTADGFVPALLKELFQVFFGNSPAGSDLVRRQFTTRHERISLADADFEPLGHFFDR